MKRTLIILALAALALTGCNKEMAHKPIAASSDGELSVLPMQSNGSISTRGYVESAEFKETTYESLHSVTKESVDRKMQISAYLYPQNGEQKNYFVDKTYAKGDDGLWHNTTSEGIDPIYWPVGGTLDFLAYSVSAKDSKNITAVWNSEDAANDITLKVPAENSQNDILFASAFGIESRSSAQAVAMKFNHAQAWLEFVLTGSTDDVNTDGIVTLERIELEKVYNAGTLAIDNNNGNATAKWDFSGEQRQNIEVDNCYGVAKLNAAPQYLDMLIPQQTKTAFVLYYTLGSSDKELSYRFTTDQKTWLMGEKYVYSIKINSSEVIVNPTVVSWEAAFTETESFVKIKYDSEIGTAALSGESISPVASVEDLYICNTWGGEATLTAEVFDEKKADWVFEKWSDGSTENPHNVIIEGDSVYEAIFTQDAPVITVAENEADCGAAAIVGKNVKSVKYAKGSEVQISATPTGYYKFIRWDDDNTDNPRTITVEETKTFKAIFGFDMSVIYDNNRSYVSGGNPSRLISSGTIVKVEGKTFTFCTYPKEGFKFLKYVVNNEESFQNSNVFTPFKDGVSDCYAYFVPGNAIGVHSQFSVATDKKVVFSPGNLIAYGAEENVSLDFSDDQTRYNQWNFSKGADYLGWSSTDGVAWGAKYSNDNSIFGTTFKDWGTSDDFKFSNQHPWRTLSAAEWNYLLNVRTVKGGTGEGHTYQRATIGGTFGMIIYPDGYTAQTASNSSIPNGCVFLVAGGAYMNMGYALNTNTIGYYWASDALSGVWGNGLQFSAEGVKIIEPGNKAPWNAYYRKSVRLVSDVQ